MKQYINSKEHKDWSLAVRTRDGHCLVCKRTDVRLNAHHLIPKNFKQYRSTLDNGFTLCYGCHTGGRYSAHKHPLWFSNWLHTYYPDVYKLTMERIHETR